LPTASFVMVVSLLSYLVSQTKKSQLVFMLAWITGPLLLLIFDPRDYDQLLASVEIAIVILMAMFVGNIYAKMKKPLAIALSILIVGLFIYTNFSSLITYRIERRNNSTPQGGTNLADQLMVLDFMYEKAEGRPFSIAVFSNPYGYYITWAYLSNWYAQPKYGYVPSYYGGSQAGLVGEGLLETKKDTEKDHFIVFEPGLIGLVPDSLVAMFEDDQKNCGEIKAVKFVSNTEIRYCQATLSAELTTEIILP